MIIRQVVLCFAVLWCVGGCSPSPPRASESEGDLIHTIYVIRREHHTGIAVATADWPDRNWPVLADFPKARYLEFGWGDAVYYQAEEVTLGMTLAAALWPTPSVMEVLALSDISLREAADYQIVELKTSEREFRALTASIASSFAGETVMPTGTAWQTTLGDHRFYHAHESFHFFRMCNRWTAERLQSLGCSIGALPVITASRALREARNCVAARAE